MLKSEAHQYQYLFLGGILGEVLELPFVGNYLKENKILLEQQGVTDIHCHTLNSFKSADDNAHTLNELIVARYLKSKKKLIIFCHSKACLEALLAVNVDLILFKKAVHRIICVQPPFQGSSVLDGFLLKQICRTWPGLKSLSKNAYSKKLSLELLGDADKHAYLEKHLLVIKAYSPRSRDVSWIIRPSHFIMKRTGKPNDGLVELNDQVLPEAKFRELEMEMDHSDLFTSKRLSSKGSEFRLNLMVKIINAETALN